MVPCCPTAQTLLGSLAQTPRIRSLVPVLVGTQAESGLRCSIVLGASIAQTSLTPVPPTPLKVEVVKAAAADDHSEPSQRRTVPRSATAQTLSELLPHTPQTGGVVPVVVETHAESFQW